MKTPAQVIVLSSVILAAARAASYAAARESPASHHVFLVNSKAHLAEGSTQEIAAEPDEGMYTPEGGINPFANRQDVEWSEHSSVPTWLQYILVFLWVSMLASIPFIIPLLDQRPVTNTHKALGGTMLVVLFGGFWLFTNIILFQSGHFKRIRPLTNVECIYFMSQVITTVGYGDVTPAKTRGQVFVGFYVLGALFVIAMLVSEMQQVIIKKAKTHFQKAKEGQAADPNIRELVFHKKPSPKNLLMALAVFAFIDILWIMFFSMHPGEGKNVFQALYMSVITLSTVGFGFFTPVTEAGMIFGAFMMFFGAAALGAVIGNFTSLMVEMNQWERARQPDSNAEAATLLKAQLDEKKAEEVTELQFMRFIMLQSQVATAPQLDNIAAAFNSLNPSQGKVPLNKVLDVLSSTDDTSKVK